MEMSRRDILRTGGLFTVACAVSMKPSMASSSEV
jgi:hypothetical protein